MALAMTEPISNAASLDCHYQKCTCLDVIVRARRPREFCDVYYEKYVCCAGDQLLFFCQNYERYCVDCPVNARVGSWLLLQNITKSLTSFNMFKKLSIDYE